MKSNAKARVLGLCVGQKSTAINSPYKPANLSLVQKREEGENGKTITLGIYQLVYN